MTNQKVAMLFDCSNQVHCRSNARFHLKSSKAKKINKNTASVVCEKCQDYRNSLSRCCTRTLANPPPPPKKWKKIDPFFPVHCKHLKIVMLPRCLFLTSQLTLYEKNTLRNEMFADEGTLATDAELWKWSHCTLDEENSAKLEILTGKKRRLEINR